MDGAQEVGHFVTKVLGVTHANDDGKSRQKVIERLSPPERLELVHDDENPLDPNGVKVCRANGEQIGYLSSELAQQVVSRSAEGYRYAGIATEVTGGGQAKLGVNMMLLVVEPDATDEQVALYLSELDLPGFDTEVIVITPPEHGAAGPLDAAARLLTRRWWVALPVLGLAILVLVLGSGGKAPEPAEEPEPGSQAEAAVAQAEPAAPPPAETEAEEQRQAAQTVAPPEPEPQPQEEVEEANAAAGRIAAGMTPAEVLKVLGEPEKKLSAGTVEKQLEVWTYADGREVRFVNGALEETPQQ